MAVPVSFSDCREIQRILNLRGDRRLAVENEITERILSLSEEQTPGLRLKFLESRKRGLDGGTWEEYFVLYKMKKWSDTVDYLEYVFKCLATMSSNLKNLNIDSIGLQEVDCSEAESYYILIYILSNGQEQSRGEENEESYEGFEW